MTRARTRLPVLIAALLPLALAADSAVAQEGESFDVVIANGRVMDPETGLDGIRWVGIRGETVVAISQTPLDGETMIDASGLVVAPGFIDLHAHGQTARANEFQVMDGVTVALELEGGVPDMGYFLDQREGDALIHYGASVAHGGARGWVMAQARRAQRDAQANAADDVEAQLQSSTVSESRYDALDPSQYPLLWERLDKGLTEGGLGIGMPHQYYPGVTYDEIFRVFEYAAEYNAPIYTHVRDMGVAPIQEVVANAVATGAPLHIVHLNSSSLWDWQTNLDLIMGAQARGADITTEAYPYTAASTSLQSAIFDEGWQDNLRISYGDLQWQDTGERLTEESFNRYRAQGGTVIIHMMKPEWIRGLLEDPGVMVASDGMPYAPGAHPRSAGTFARFLGRYVREEGLVPLMTALEKMTLMPAQRLETISPQMKRKGRIQIGSDADITVFDPDRIIDTATFEDDLSFSEGVEFVVVAGTVVVREGEIVEGVRPGQPILGRRVVF